MKYTLSNLVGDAGEHLVAAKIIKLFGFPCRLMAIDLGIDAEIEIINSENKSTGEFLKCQIKTRNSGELYLYLEERHVAYWNSINIPVIIFLVHLNTEKIYWHSIKSISQYERLTNGIRVDFNQNDTLKKSSKKTFIDLVHFKSFEEIRRIYDDAYNVALQDKILYLDTDNYDFVTIELFVQNLIKIEYDLGKVKKMQRRNKNLEKVNLEYYDKLEIISDYISEVSQLRDNILSEEGPNYYDYLKSENQDWD